MEDTNDSATPKENDATKLHKGLGWVALGTGLAGLSVMLGAFGAHSLKSLLTEKKLATFHTATDYLGYHALGLILIGILIYHLQGDIAHKLNRSAIWISFGITFFCGSLYGLVFDGPRLLGPITPLGGLCFMIGWLTATYNLIKILKN
jgi:uncharacterized membrane protein YgdD (TMEM256/DUF423 family)